MRAPTATRREILTALLGGALAAGCPRKTPEIGWDGDFVDDFADLGHLLRDGAPLPAVGGERRRRVLVLGGGVAGLSAAWTLGRSGLRGAEDLAVLDLAAEPGGTAASGRSPVGRYPWGAHYVPAPGPENPDLLALLEELGAVSREGDALQFAEHHLCAMPEERVFYEGAWQPGLVPSLGRSDAEAAQWARFTRELDRWVAFRDADGRRAFTLPIAHGSDAPEVLALDDLSFAEWLDARGFDAPLLRWAARYACRDDFGCEPEDTSAYYGLHYFCARVPAPGEDSAPFLTWPEGNGRIVRHLVERIGAGRVHAGQVVSRIRPEPEGVRVDTVDAASRRRVTWRAERVVFALPSFLRRYLVADAPGWAPGYAPWLVANVHLSRRPGYHGFETAWDNVIHGSESLGYVVSTHQSGPRLGPTVWTWYRPMSGADPKAERERLASLTWREASDAVVYELDRTHLGLKDALQKVELRRWGHGMVRPVPGTAKSAERRGAAAPWRGVHFAHTDLSGVALVEEAFFHGVRAGREVAAALGPVG